MTFPASSLRPDSPSPHRVDEIAGRLGLELTGPGQVEVSGVCADDRGVLPGDLFAALPGARVHGAAHAQGALSRGARAVLTDRQGLELLRGGPLTGDLAAEVPVLVAADVRSVLGPVAAHVHDEPARTLTAFGVTGTNGKTTTTFVLDHVLSLLGWSTGLIGTVETRFGRHRLPSALTTPEAADLQAWLAAMREQGVQTLAMEVSSHAIAQGRVDGLVFDVAGFTNLSQDHLDFHGDLPSYFEAKRALFTPQRARRAVVVVDDAWGLRLAEQAEVPVATLRTGGGHGVDTSPGRGGAGTAVDPGVEAPGPERGWVVREIVADARGSDFTLTDAEGRTLRTRIDLPGGFNVANAALALVMLVEGGVDLADLAAALETAGGIRPVVPGRMETIGLDGVDPSALPRVIVDFAHNPEALELALRALRPSTTGRLLLVFGATGDRDPSKRPLMGGVAAAHSDVAFVTDDDPHGEDPAVIRAAVLAGAAGAGVAEVHEERPRAVAIRRAVAGAAPGDTVLIAGRGHETVQDVAGVDHPLDDRTEARDALREWWNGRRTGTRGPDAGGPDRGGPHSTEERHA